MIDERLVLVVQGVVSLTSSIRCQLARFMPTTISNTQLFFVENITLSVLLEFCNINIYDFKKT